MLIVKFCSGKYIPIFKSNFLVIIHFKVFMGGIFIHNLFWGTFI